MPPLEAQQRSHPWPPRTRPSRSRNRRPPARPLVADLPSDLEDEEIEVEIGNDEKAVQS